MKEHDFDREALHTAYDGITPSEALIGKTIAAAKQARRRIALHTLIARCSSTAAVLLGLAVLVRVFLQAAGTSPDAPVGALGTVLSSGSLWIIIAVLFGALCAAYFILYRRALRR